jgi:hypothetical protein
VRLLQAFVRQCNNTGGIVYMNSRLYQRLREDLTIRQSRSWETKFGADRAQEVKEKLVSSLTGRKWTSEERSNHATSQKVKDGNVRSGLKRRGVPRDDGTKKAISEGMKRLRTKQIQDRHDPVIRLDTFEVFQNTTVLFRQTGVSNVERSIARGTTSDGSFWTKYDETKPRSYYEEERDRLEANAKRRRTDGYANRRPSSRTRYAVTTYTNGTVEKQVFEGDVPPEGWWVGRKESFSRNVKGERSCYKHVVCNETGEVFSSAFRCNKKYPEVYLSLRGRPTKSGLSFRVLSSSPTEV